MRAQLISDRDWEARYDAESLAKAEEIKADPSRLNAAETMARKIAEEKEKELTGLNRVANRGKAKRTAQESTQNRTNVPKNKPKPIKKTGTAPKASTRFNVFKKI